MPANERQNSKVSTGVLHGSKNNDRHRSAGVVEQHTPTPSMRTPAIADSCSLARRLKSRSSLSAAALEPAVTRTWRPRSLHATCSTGWSRARASFIQGDGRQLAGLVGAMQSARVVVIEHGGGVAAPRGQLFFFGLAQSPLPTVPRDSALRRRPKPKPRESAVPNGEAMARTRVYALRQRYSRGVPAVATCECFDAPGSCDAEAASRPGTRVVTSCPPPGEREIVACATEGQNCSQSYLEQQGLKDCCEGLLCMPNGSGVPVCSPGTPEQIARYQECQKAEATVGTSTGPTLSILDPLVTDAGELAFDTVQYSFIETGPNGCVGQVDFLLTQANATACSLEIIAGPAADSSGHLLVQSARLSANDCAGPAVFHGYLLIQNVGGTVAFDGVSCVGDCIAGSFTINMTGTFITSSVVTLTGAPMRLEGADCAVPSLSACPGG